MSFQFLSALLLATSIAVYVVEIGKEHVGLVKKPLISEILVVDLNVSSVRFILWTLIIIAVIWMIFSGLLVVGIVKVGLFVLLGFIKKYIYFFKPH